MSAFNLTPPMPNSLQHLQIIPTGGALGAEIKGVDVSQPFPPDVSMAIRRGLMDHGVLYFRDQQISDEDQVRFTRYFGEPIPHVRKQQDRRVKEIFIISNVKENGESIGALGNADISFHSDLSYMPKPGTLSTLYAIELPRTGGETQWINCYTAYETLDETMKIRVAGLRAVHRHYVKNQNPPEQVAHPVVRTHPETGRQSLYVGPHLTKYIVGLPEEESAELLEILYAHVMQPRFIWTHEWRVDDLVIWDNRPTMHRRAPFPDTERRIMKRTQVFGDEVPV